MKYTKNAFLEEAIKIHGNIYDYSQIPKHLYSQPKIIIYCKKHDCKFEQTISKHLSGQTGCKQCSKEKKKKQNLSVEAFIKKAKSIHGNKYNYDKVEYINNHKKIIIGCNAGHPDFEKTPANHTHKSKPQGCPECSGRVLWTKERFIREATNIHHIKVPRYDYSKVNFINSSKKVIIICKEHGEFEQTPQKHLDGQKCKKCSANIVANKNRLTTAEFIKKANKVHSNSYDYSKTEYLNNYSKVCITCEYHGDFCQNPSSHLQGSGCPICKLPKGEQKIAAYLENKKIEFIQQFKFPKSRLSYDFMFEKNGKKYLVEYNGEHHYKPIKYSKNDSKSEDKFRYRIEKDKQKEILAIENKYTLITIKHDDENFMILEKLFCK